MREAVSQLFLRNTYLYNIMARITQKGLDKYGYWLRLDQTIFHPQGGGQKSDVGTINGVQVVGLFHEKEINEINHYVPEEAFESFEVDQDVEIMIDQKVRLEYAALHTAGHFMAQVVEKAYDTEATKGHQFPKEAYYEFKKLKTPIDQEAMKLKIQVDVEDGITKGYPVDVCFNANNDRFIRINSEENPSPVGCGGTHLSNLNQIGFFNIRNIRTRKGILRIGYDAGISEDALNDQTLETNVVQI